MERKATVEHTREDADAVRPLRAGQSEVTREQSQANYHHEHVAILQALYTGGVQANVVAFQVVIPDVFWKALRPMIRTWEAGSTDSRRTLE
jgi:hypothetical protein